MTFWDFLSDNWAIAILLVYLVFDGIKEIVRAWKSGCKCKEEL